MTEDLRNDPEWRKKAPYGLHVDGTPLTKENYEALHAKPQQLNVKIDTSTVEDLARKKIELEGKEAVINENLDEVERTKQIFNDLKSAVEGEYEKQHFKVPKIETVDDLNNASENLSELKRRTQKGTAQGGSAPLQNQFLREKKEGYGSYEEMVSDLRDKASHSNPDVKSRQEAQKVIDELMRKAIRGQKEHGNLPFNYKGENVLEFRKQQFQRRKKLEKGEL